MDKLKHIPPAAGEASACRRLNFSRLGLPFAPHQRFDIYIRQRTLEAVEGFRRVGKVACWHVSILALISKRQVRHDRRSDG